MIENKEKKTKEKKTRNRPDSDEIKKTFFKVGKSTAILCVVMLAAAFGYSKYMDTYPYKVMADDEVLCYVEDADAAETVMQEVAGTLAEEGSTVKLIKGNVSIKVDRADSRKVEKAKLKTIEEAVNEIVDTAQENGGKDDLNITVISTKIEEKTYTPEPNYVKNDEAIAGTAVVEKEGRKGKCEMLKTYETVDGKLVSTQEDVYKVITEGEPATIVKGTLGLPEGEDWQTYEGDPVLSNGSDVIVSAKSYIGKVKYVLGGKSLTSGVDCVGFVRAIYALYGINLSSHLRREGRRVSYSDAKPGDIICYSRHVGIYAGNGMMVDATSGKNVSLRAVSKGKLQQVRRIVG